jgi:hypothetical protein
MTTEQIIETIKIILAGRKIIGRVYVVRDAAEFEVRAFVLNADGIGKRDTLLAAFGTADQAITVQRAMVAA